MNKATIHYHDIGDYLDQKEKLKIISNFKSFANEQMPLQILESNEHGDWISLRNDVFGTFTALGDKDDKTNKNTFFVPFYSNGLKTNRDAWVYNYSKDLVLNTSKKTIDFYNEQVNNYLELSKKPKVEDFIGTNPTKISWSRALREDLAKGKKYIFNKNNVVMGAYRPFCKLNLFFDRQIINDLAKIPKLFPNSTFQNLVICISANSKDGSVLIADHIPDLHFNGDTQVFPLYYYEENNVAQKGLFDTLNPEPNTPNYIRRDAISDFILEKAKKQYGIAPSHLGRAGGGIIKEDIFYYVYGFLHSPSYREMFANDLKKMLPRLPLVEDVRDFWKFSNAGRKLAELHLNYESVPGYEGCRVQGIDIPNPNPNTPNPFEVTKMRFPKKGERDTIIYNNQITVENIPEKAYEYVVNGKSAIEWVMERYQVSTHKESGITNNPNDWAAEHQQPRYILDLLLSIINVSVQTVDIVEGLPKVAF